MSRKIIDKNIISLNLEIKRPNKILVLSASVFIVLILGLLDFFSGNEVSFSIFYLIPISLSVFFAGFKTGIANSILSVIIWFLADIFAKQKTYTTLLVPVWNAGMISGYYFLHIFFLSRLLTLYEESRIKSFTDPLTNIPNLHFFSETFNRELKKAIRTSLPFTLVYIDLDNFKSINDSFGHFTGDELLKLFTKSISDNIRPGDLAARLGGDEFVFLLPETDVDESKIIVKRIDEIVKSVMQKKNWPVTMSVGMITFKKFDLTVDDMLKMADHLMYNVKDRGKNDIRHEVWP